MADKEGEENVPRGNEWEVVSLTASAYAAAPGPQKDGLTDDDKGYTVEAETSHALFMSGHFVFPPSEHENLPLEPEPVKSDIHNEPVKSDIHNEPVKSDIHNESVGKDVLSEFKAEESGKSSGKIDDENWDLKGLSVHNEFPGIQIFDEKGNRISFSGTEFEESKTLQGVHLTDKDDSIYVATTVSSFHDEALGGPTTYDENMTTSELKDLSDQSLGLSADTSKSIKAKDVKRARSGLPCDAWWKRGAASLYTHAKEANTFWSIFVAAAVMGLVIIGQKWQQESWQALQLKWRLSVNDEKASRIVAPISRLKDAIVGGHRRGIRGSVSSDQ